VGENRAVLEEVLIIWFSFGDRSLKFCYCTLGTRVPLQTQQGRVRFLQNAVMLEHLLSNPHLMLAGGTGMVDILVPRLPREESKKAHEHYPAGVNGVGNGWEWLGRCGTKKNGKEAYDTRSFCGKWWKECRAS
jgi:hypothetical protein